MALPAATLGALPAAFWNVESQVNGVWTHLLAGAFAGGNNFVVCPENVAATGTLDLRADMNVLQITPPTGRTIRAFAIALTFEGKRQNVAARNVDDVIAQLQRYATNVPTSNGNFFCIAAIGKTFKLFVKTGTSSIIGLNMTRAGGQPATAARTGGATAATAYDVVTDYVRLMATLQWIAANTFPLDTAF